MEQLGPQGLAGGEAGILPEKGQLRRGGGPVEPQDVALGM